MSVIEAYGWKHVTILYEDNNALIRLKVIKINATILRNYRLS